MKAAGLYDRLKRANRTEAPSLTMTDDQRAALVALFRDDVARLSSVHALAPPWATTFPDLSRHLGRCRMPCDRPQDPSPGPSHD
jgi:hypothetical protein